MTTRIDTRFAALKAEGRPALVTFVTAGDPDYATSLEILKALPKVGADLVELGMPFSDPMADGPAIQASGQRALKGGQTLKTTLDLAREFRKGDDATPIVMMGYYNPIYIYGVEKFLDDAIAAGIDGLIVVGKDRGGELARGRSVIRAAAHHPARIAQHGGDAVAQRVGRHRLEQELVDADAHRLDDAGALAVPGEHDDGHVGQRKGARRAHHAHEAGPVQTRHLPIEDR